MSYEVITLGETMIRLTPPGFDRIEQASGFEMHVGGSESNTAVGLSRLGVRVAWLSRLTNNPLGQYLASGIRAQGVDVSHVVWTDEDRIGTYYMERGKPPRGSQVFYDRAGSAASKISPRDLPEELFSDCQCKLFHTTGITLGISSSSRATAIRAAEMAKSSGTLVSFDTNHRERLWSADDAREAYEQFMALSDFIFLPLRDAHCVLGLKDEDPHVVLLKLTEQYPSSTIVLTLGDQGAVACKNADRIYTQAAFPAEEVERLGGGDAFSAGVLAGIVHEEPLEIALRRGAAAAALKYTIPGDLPLLDACAVDRLVSGDTGQKISR